MSFFFGDLCQMQEPRVSSECDPCFPLSVDQGSGGRICPWCDCWLDHSHERMYWSVWIVPLCSRSSRVQSVDLHFPQPEQQSQEWRWKDQVIGRYGRWWYWTTQPGTRSRRRPLSVDCWVTRHPLQNPPWLMHRCGLDDLQQHPTQCTGTL